jgi:hypothetical protein
MLQLRNRVVETPQGVSWRIGRLWVSRPMPRWRRVRLGDGASDAAWNIPIPDVGSIDDLAAVVFVLVGAVVFAVVLIPLLLFGAELIIVGLLIAAGILGRSILGRPWVVRANRRERTRRGAGMESDWSEAIGTGHRGSRRIAGQRPAACAGRTSGDPRHGDGTHSHRALMLVAVRYGGERWLARERELGEVPAREAYPQPDAGYDELPGLECVVGARSQYRSTRERRRSCPVIKPALHLAD